ncbi:hypothetical protein OBBRIDRAFT_792115 [Obba rivulosa]|uniref:BZIP domain-containing protein n=1 Tax=Obba rivulosa TaxID=1052685 RepID=A0A8E2AYU5_9APHY|nr:hypothetical protein OBBRIDRAFT_792115 [Obba rivulosa]
MADELINDGTASPEFQALNDFGEYLTSPLETPWEDFLNTPALGSGDPLLTSPAIVDADDFSSFADQPLFADAGLDLGVPTASGAFKQHVIGAPTSTIASPFNFDGLYTLPSPTTPALDPQSLTSSPRVASIHRSPTPSVTSDSRRKNAPTGTRKNITPEALVPVDAPIQSRKYVTPSATSRKEVPAAIAKKRARSQAFGDEEDDGTLGPEDLDAIEAKRRQNTLAARRSRKRKLEYQQQLETEAERMRIEADMWRTRAVTLEVLLQSHGHEVPPLVQPQL